MPGKSSFKPVLVLESSELTLVDRMVGMEAREGPVAQVATAPGASLHRRAHLTVAEARDVVEMAEQAVRAEPGGAPEMGVTLEIL